MSQTGDERLLVLVEARITDLEKNMRKASATTGREFGKMRKDAGSATRAMEADVIRSSNRIREATASIGGAIGSLGKGALAGVGVSIAGLGLGELWSQARATATEIANIGSEAQRAGVSAKAFQELGYVAQQNRIPIDALTDGLKELALRADELVQTGAGPAAESFHRLGISAEDLKEKLKDPQALMIEIIGKLGELDKASQIRISDELFGGTAGERFVELIDDGAEGIRRLIQEANDLGMVMDEEMIAKAAEIDRQFTIVSNTVGTYLKGAIVNAASALAMFIDGFNDFQNQQSSTIKKTLELNLEDQTAKKLEIDDIIEQQARDPAMGNLYQQQIEARQRELAAMRDEYSRLNSTLQTRTLPPAPEDPKSTLNPEPFKAGGGKAKKAPRDAAAEKAKREAEAVAELIAELEREKGLIGASDVEREISNGLRQAGAAATDAQKAKITELITAIDAETKAHERLQEQQEAMKDVASDALHTIADGIRSGAEAGEILGDVLDNLADKLIDMAINNLVENAFPSGKGGGGGGFGAVGDFLSSIFGGFKAEGGPVSGNKVYAVGERGPELFAPGRSGTIIPNHALGMSSATTAPSITIGGTSVVVQGDASQTTLDEMRAMFKQRDRELPSRVVAAYNEAKIRGRIR